MRNNTLWFQFSSGQGPMECEWIVGRLLDIFCLEAERNGLECSILTLTRGKISSASPVDQGKPRFRSALVEIRGQAGEEFTRQWCGTIQWIGQSPFRPKNRRRNWFVAIDPVQPGTRVDLRDLENQVTATAFRAGGPGGQHVNKTSSGIRLIHHPTGVTVEVQDERSQHRNKQIALKRLEFLLSRINHLEEGKLNENRWKKHQQLERGNPRRVFFGPEFAAR